MGRNMGEFGEPHLGAEYTPEEVEFMMFMDDMKHRTGIRFPKWTDILAWARQLGYEKVKCPTNSPLRS